MPRLLRSIFSTGIPRVNWNPQWNSPSILPLRNRHLQIPPITPSRIRYRLCTRGIKVQHLEVCAVAVLGPVSFYFKVCEGEDRGDEDEAADYPPDDSPDGS